MSTKKEPRKSRYVYNVDAFGSPAFAMRRPRTQDEGNEEGPKEIQPSERVVVYTPDKGGRPL